MALEKQNEGMTELSKSKVTTVANKPYMNSTTMRYLYIFVSVLPHVSCFMHVCRSTTRLLAHLVRDRSVEVEDVVEDEEVVVNSAAGAVDEEGGVVVVGVGEGGVEEVLVLARSKASSLSRELRSHLIKTVR